MENVFSNFEDLIFFVEKTAGTFVREIQTCQQLLFERARQAHWSMSNMEKKTALKVLQRNRNIDAFIIDTDKKVCPAYADKEDTIKESRRQLYEKNRFITNLLKKKLTSLFE